MPDYVIHTYTPSGATREFNLADNYWSNYSEGSLMLFLQMTLVMMVSAQQAPFLARTVINKFVDGVKVRCGDAGWCSGRWLMRAGRLRIC